MAYFWTEGDSKSNNKTCSKLKFQHIYCKKCIDIISNSLKKKKEYRILFCTH